jgi:hypothetical protein
MEQPDTGTNQFDAIVSHESFNKVQAGFGNVLVGAIVKTRVIVIRSPRRRRQGESMEDPSSIAS